MTTVIRLLFVLSLTLPVVGCSATSSSAPGSEATDATSSAPAGGRVDGPAARGLVADGALLLDVRTAGEFAQGHVEGAVNIPFDEVGAHLSELEPKTRPIVVYCHSGRRSAIAATTLRSEGFTVHDLGPMTAW